mgnify:CR=1 FL=1
MAEQHGQLREGDIGRGDDDADPDHHDDHPDQPLEPVQGSQGVDVGDAPLEDLGFPGVVVAHRGAALTP